MCKECSYISKNEIKEYKREFEEVILNVKLDFKNEYGKSFNHMIVGSAKRNLIVQRGKSNWDIDYQFNLDSTRFKEIDSSKIKFFVQNLFKKYLDDRYNVKLSTSVITISSEDKSFDVALVRKNNYGEREILRGKNEGDIKWELLEHSKFYERKKEINGWNQWKDLREIFLDKKCQILSFEKDKRKSTVSLLLESIKETLDIYQ